MKKHMQKNNMGSKPKGFPGIQSKTGKAVLIASSVLIVLVLAFILGLRIYYSSHWYPNTWIGNRDVSGMSCEESTELMNYVYDNYQLNISGRNNATQTITQGQINYQADIQNSVQEQFDTQHASFPLFSFGRKKQIRLTLNAAYDKQKLSQLLRQSVLYMGSESNPIVKPVDANVVFSKEKQYLVVEEEVRGNTLNLAAFIQAVQTALDTGYEKLDLTDESQNPDVYKKPRIYSTDKMLQEKAAACNAAALRWFTWKIDKNVSESVGPQKIYSWCRYNNGKVTYKKTEIQNWVEKICLKYKTVGITRTFKNHAGKKIKVAGGDYGWAFNYETMLKQLNAFLKKKVNPALQQSYMENPDEKHKKALTVSKKPKFLNTAFQYDYENKANDWDTKNFTEISLSDQKVYVWRHGKVVFKCRTISGRPVPDRETRKGAYFIKEHQPHRVLKGDDYETPVDNWVRIMWTGTGFHAAPWQPWYSWSKTTYLTRGSHGCLNLSVEDSKKIYKLTKYMEMVFIY